MVDIFVEVITDMGKTEDLKKAWLVGKCTPCQPTRMVTRPP